MILNVCYPMEIIVCCAQDGDLLIHCLAVVLYDARAIMVTEANVRFGVGVNDMVYVPVDIKFDFKRQADMYGKCEVARYRGKSSYSVSRDKYWSMDTMDYKLAWFVTMQY